jgi:hypothetical protein
MTGLFLSADDMVRDWICDGFRLELYDTNEWDKLRSSPILSYRLYDNGQLIFEGDDFGPSPMYSIDGDRTVAALLSFLSLRKGDTDSEYFDKYTPDQISWRDSDRSEYLQCLAMELEERAES